MIARDCSPLDPQPNPVEADWLRQLTANIHACDLVIPVSSFSDDDEPVVYCNWDGTWWAGRYVGNISFQGKRLTILPRFGLSTLRNWFCEATSVVLTEAPGRLREDESFIALLLASVWSYGFVSAARHGLPSLRCNVPNKGMTIRGKLDVPGSIRLIASGEKEMVSLRTEKSLNHATSRSIVAAYSVLRRWLPDEKWIPQRVKELLPHLLAVTGPRPCVPTKNELDRIRYTPITIGFAPLAELSRKIARRRGLSSEVEANSESKGVLLDVAELWELYVLSVLRKAATPLTVKHGTREQGSTKKLLWSEVNGQGFGTLIPDAILYSKRHIRGVVDAKYKSIHPTAYSALGPQREDLYQMAAYLERFSPGKGLPAWGLLAYPEHPDLTTIAPSEQGSPWQLSTDKKIVFTSLPHDAASATAKLRDWIVKMNLSLAEAPPAF
ncbi:MAG: hypothetical protein C4555_04315 [Dehalococcoidia bacterium]|jgi:5-methylcytosine-specific restriction enzyme subunit McrC|nr:MAG: hypothetical protein C4555_04315 [Dehalococcoidia bacterium]